MLTRFARNNLTWIDLHSPTSAEVAALRDEFTIHPLVAEELLLPTAKPRFESHPEHLYLIFHFPTLHHTREQTEHEVDFIIGKSFIITTHYDTVESVQAFSKLFEAQSILDQSVVGDHPGFLFFALLKRLYKAVEHEVDVIGDHLSYVEKEIFKHREMEMVKYISRSSRDLLHLRQVLEPHRDILRTLQEDGTAFFGHDFSPYLRSLSNEYFRVHSRIMRHTESLHELRETNNSLLYTKQNEVMKTLTILAFVTFSLSLIASIFGMNTLQTPLVGLPYDFWIIVGLMFVGTILMFWYFKHKKWL